MTDIVAGFIVRGKGLLSPPSPCTAKRAAPKLITIKRKGNPKVALVIDQFLRVILVSGQAESPDSNNVLLNF